MNNFEYLRAASMQDAIKQSAAQDAQYIAGGTELLNWMRLRIVEPARLVDIGFVPEPGADRALRRRARHRRARHSQRCGPSRAGRGSRADARPGVSQGCLGADSQPGDARRQCVAEDALRVFQRPRRPLPWPCNKRSPGSGCAALNGVNERHAIFGWTDACAAVHPSDPLVALACLDAAPRSSDPSGRRTIAMTRISSDARRKRVPSMPACAAAPRGSARVAARCLRRSS